MSIRRQSKGWIKYLEESHQSLLNSKASPFSRLTPSMIPEVGGVYLISARLNKKEIAYYIGRSKNLRGRLYTSHLMGSLHSARLKRYLTSSGECKDVNDAKDFIKKYCWVRWIEVDDIRKRGAIEGYATGLLFPKYGIYEEH